MTAEHERAIRVAVDDLVAALLEAVREEAQPVGPAPERLLSVPEAAKALGLGRSATYEELGAGRLASFKVGRRRLVPASAIAAYVAGAVDGR